MYPFPLKRAFGALSRFSTICFSAHQFPSENILGLYIRAVQSESSLGAFRIAKDEMLLHAYNKDSDQTAGRAQAHMSEGMFSHVEYKQLAVLTLPRNSSIFVCILCSVYNC